MIKSTVTWGSKYDMENLTDSKKKILRKSIEISELLNTEDVTTCLSILTSTLGNILIGKANPTNRKIVAKSLLEGIMKLVTEVTDENKISKTLKNIKEIEENDVTTDDNFKKHFVSNNESDNEPDEKDLKSLESVKLFIESIKGFEVPYGLSALATLVTAYLSGFEKMQRKKMLERFINGLMMGSEIEGDI